MVLVSVCPRLIAAILSVARKQYSLLRDANLLTPDMVSEFEELERLVRQGTGVTLEQTSSPSRAADVTGTSAAPGCDGEDLGLDLSPLLCLRMHWRSQWWGSQFPAIGTRQR